MRVYNRKDILIYDSSGYHGICIHIFHRQAFHGFFIAFSRLVDQLRPLFGRLLVFFLLSHIFLDRKQYLSLCRQCGKGQRTSRLSQNPFILSIQIFSCVGKIKDQSYPYAYIITGTGKTFLLRMLFYDDILTCTDSRSTEIRKIILHLKFIILIIFSANGYSSIISKRLGNFRKYSIISLIYDHF